MDRHRELALILFVEASHLPTSDPLEIHTNLAAQDPIQEYAEIFFTYTSKRISDERVWTPNSLLKHYLDYEYIPRRHE